jgi:pilus assembly protein CpaB
METVNKRVILIAIIMALITSFLVYLYISGMTTQKDVVDYINVYIAAKTLPPKYKITESDIKQTKVTKEYLNPKALTNRADIVGKSLKESVIQGEQILSDRLVDDKNTTLAYSIPEGKRAVSINVNEQTEVANLIRPGDSVDVIANFGKEEVEDKTTKTIYPAITKIIIQNVEVLALGQDQLVSDEKTKDLPKTVTLAVTPEESEKLVYASEFATVRLALRPSNDNKDTVTEGVIGNDLTSGRGVIVVQK